jgi:hypothetical protein
LLPGRIFSEGYPRDLRAKLFHRSFKRWKPFQYKYRVIIRNISGLNRKKNVGGKTADGGFNIHPW